MTLLGPRRSTPERIDGPGLDEERLARSHGRVEEVNRLLGGHRALRLHLRDLRDVRGLDLLDVGAGNGSSLLLLGRWARERAGAWRMVGAEIHPGTVRIAARRTRGRDDVALVRADGLRLPFPTDAFDVAISVLTLHHFDDEGARAILREMGRVARLRVLANDLERCVPNYLGARILAATLWRSDPLTRHDGPVSVLRSFTPDELRSAGEDAGLREVRVRRRFPFRLVLEARPPADGASGVAAPTAAAEAGEISTGRDR